ncbi:aminopeptidase P family N-terminal domain-containing protein, partial [Actinomadura adrarensis]
MADAGLGALVIAGRGVISQYGYLEYVTGWCPIIRLGYAVLVPGREPVMVMPTASDAYYAREATGFSDVRVGGQGDVISDHDGVPEGVAAVLAEHGVARGRVGVVGLQHIIAAYDFDALRAAAPEAEFTDATAMISELKAVKTADEVREVLRSGEIADAGMRVVMDR